MLAGLAIRRICLTQKAKVNPKSSFSHSGMMSCTSKSKLKWYWPKPLYLCSQYRRPISYYIDRDEREGISAADPASSQQRLTISETHKSSMEGCNASARPDRKTIEKNRRIQMKDLYSKLISLLPTSNSNEGLPAPVTLPDRLDEAIKYIKGMQERMASMRKKKRLMGLGSEVMASCSGLRMLPKIEVEELSCGVRVMMVTCPSEHNRLMFWQAIRSLHMDGFEVAAASYAAADDRVFHTIHSLPPENTSGQAEKVSQRLKELAIH